MTGMISSKESELGIGSRVTLPPLLEQIAQDVTSGVLITPGVNQEGLIKGFVGGLKERVIKTKQHFYPGGEYHDDLDLLRGKDFTGQPLRDRFKTIVLTEALSKEQKTQLVTGGLTRLYGEYVTADSKDPIVLQRTWERFATAAKRFNFYCIGNKFHGDFPSWWYQEDTYVGLPTLDTRDKFGTRLYDLDQKTTLKNTTLQTEIARSIGILASEETWQQFIRRGNIKVFDRFRAYQVPEVEGVIVGGRWDKSFSLGGMPAEYRHVPTNYAQTRALVHFEGHYYGSDKYDRPLDELIDEGGISPRLVLRIPTPVFLSIEG